MTSVIDKLQSSYDVEFNYASESLEGFQVKLPEEIMDLETALELISQQTGLQFNRITNNIITIVFGSITACGQLQNAVTGEPVMFATVTAGKRYTTTNESGYFELTELGWNSSLQIRHIGYRSITLSGKILMAENCPVIQLEPNQQQLAEVVLYDYLTKGIDKLDNGSFTIDFNQFEILPGLIENDVLQSVQAFPGIQSINETVSDINIRGGSNDQNLILWDDIKMYQSGHFFGLISMYNPQITQRLTLRKNGSPVNLTDGVSGTILMETEGEINRDLKGNFAMNFIDASAYSDIPIGESSSLQLAFRKSISNFWETPTYSEYFDRISQETEITDNTDQVINSDIEFDFYDASARWLYTPTDRDEIQLNFILASNELIFDENAQVNNETITRQSQLEQNSVAAGLQYRRHWSDAFYTSLQVYNTDYQLKAVNANILNDQRFLQENKVSETGISLNSRYRLKQDLNWLNGYQFIETKVSNLDDVDNPIFRRLVAEVLRIHALYSALEWKFNQRKTHLNLGFRLNYLDKFSKIILEPRMSINHQLAKGLNLELLGEFKHQNTSQVINFQNDFLGVEKRRWQLSNDQDIPVIQSRQISAGLSYSFSGWLFNGVLYLKRVEGITTQSQGFQNQYEFVKTSGDYLARGADLLLRKQIDHWNAWLSYSYLNSDYEFDTLTQDRFPGNFDITHAVTTGITYAPGRLRLSAGFNWRTGKPFTDPSPQQPVTDGEVNYLEVNNNRLDDYMRVDISGLYNFPLGEKTAGQFGISVWNLLDRENPINTFFQPGSADTVDQVVETSLGITPNAVFRFYF